MTTDMEEIVSPNTVGTDAAAPLLRAILAVLLDAREASATKPSSPVMLLHQAGLHYKEIALVTGRSPDAVRMAISRAKSAATKKQKTSDPDGSSNA